MSWIQEAEIDELNEKIKQMNTENSILLECVKWYASFWNHDVQLEDLNITSMQRDRGQLARDCLQKLEKTL